MIVSVRGVVEKAVIILAASSEARVRGVISKDALHSTEHRLGIHRRIAAAVHYLLTSRPSYESRECRRYTRESTESGTWHII